MLVGVVKFGVLTCRNTEEYKIAARKFVDMAKKNGGNSDMIVCPCRDCGNLRHEHCDIVFDHLVMRGMDRTYTTWVLHGEHRSASVQCDEVEMLESYQMYKDVYFQDDNVVEPTHEGQEADFANLVQDAETPLYPGCKKYTKMSATVTLFKHKAANGLSEKSFNELLEIIRDMLPQDNTLPDSLYSTKKFLKTFDLGYEKIHACVNDCCLFRKEFEHMDSCPKCGSSRWKVNQRTGKVYDGVPAKVLHYFPIIPRLRRMFGSPEKAE
ncbi:hypothetical protein L1049_011155 [Liquidambar formosana]|uniref:Transposase-associated domain-containing protein n=1 Tax=Liquidambar formosana TaxID=63359 RepID=A0AAP0RR93_LIQFO